ncbi:unnamed protein product, partial [Callosobruchus maculatus]
MMKCNINILQIAAFLILAIICSTAFAAPWGHGGGRYSLVKAYGYRGGYHGGGCCNGGGGHRGWGGGGGFG